ncbi:SpoIID/LytB domain-containing protein [bacterium]|nr:SpoIID/LytB domain-containing protein [bacterium]
MKKKAVVVLIMLLFCTLPADSAYFGNIPAKTLQIARDTMNVGNVSAPGSKIVRVGIGSQDFSNYEWKTAEIYTTGEFELYNNKTYINTYSSETPVSISMVGKIFILRDSEGNVIAKVSGPIIFLSENGLLGVKNLKRAGQDALYRGNFELVSTPKESFYIINSIALEDYLKGVVPNEMPVRFGLEALKAQSVAARNYVLSPRIKSNPNYDVVDSVASQVYFGANTEKELSNQAVEETSGIVATYNWDLILAQYSSTAGGYTESYENAFSEPYTKQFPAKSKPYLTAIPDYPEFGKLDSDEAAEKFYKSSPMSYDNNSPYYRWEREWSIDELQTEIQNHIAAQSAAGFVKPAVNKGEVIGKITGLKVLQRGVSGKIMKLEIQTENSNYIVEKELVIRRLLTNSGKALPSANFVIDQICDEDGRLVYIKIYGGGFGHGVGMSQYGAGYMSTVLGMSYEDILLHYYSGISLSTEPFILSANSEQNYFKQSFFTKNSHAKVVVDNKYKVGYIDAKINGCDEKINLDKAQRINKIDISNYIQSGLNTVEFYYPAEETNKGLRIYIELAGNNE